MRQFVFKLETLLRHRRSLEEKERESLARIHARLENENRHLQELQSKHSQVRRELERQQLRQYDSREVGWYCTFMRRLDSEMEQSAARIQGLKRELQEQLARWVERSRDKKVLENLKEKREREHLIAEDRLEQKIVDEIVVTRFAGREPA